MIIGEEKCGTTSLYTNLTMHPEISKPVEKEPYYFDRKIEKMSFLEYKYNFPSLGNQLSFDSTPTYFFSERAPQNIKKTFSNMKFIVLLRNPVERTISHYYHNKRWQPWMETYPIDIAIKLETKRIEYIKKITEFPERELLTSFYSYIGKSNYEASINKWLHYFTPDNFLFVCSEDLFTNPTEAMKKVFDFLGVRIINLPFNAMNIATTQKLVNEREREFIEAKVQKLNRDLEKFTGFSVNS
ncbi:MAG: sulfotransferase [Candidatus Hodarchaeota archaeon]